MKYNQLKHLIHMIKKTLRCPECGKVFGNEEFELIDIYEEEGLIDAQCSQCKTGVSVSMEIEEFKQGLPPKIIDQIKKAEITDAEVKDISRTLHAHKGGLSDLFESHSS